MSGRHQNYFQASCKHYQEKWEHGKTPNMPCLPNHLSTLLQLWGPQGFMETFFHSTSGQHTMQRACMQDLIQNSTSWTQVWQNNISNHWNWATSVNGLWQCFITGTGLLPVGTSTGLLSKFKTYRTGESFPSPVHVRMARYAFFQVHFLPVLSTTRGLAPGLCILLRWWFATGAPVSNGSGQWKSSTGESRF
jgi:hypothetical protein